MRLLRQTSLPLGSKVETETRSGSQPPMCTQPPSSLMADSANALSTSGHSSHPSRKRVLVPSCVRQSKVNPELMEDHLCKKPSNACRAGDVDGAGHRAPARPLVDRVNEHHVLALIRETVVHVRSNDVSWREPTSRRQSGPGSDCRWHPEHTFRRRCRNWHDVTLRSQQALARCSRPSAPTQRTSVGTGTTHEPTGGGAMYFVHWPKLRDHDSRWRDVLRP